MSNRKINVNEVIQWIGSVFIIAGHTLNAAGPEVYPYNLIAFFIGTVMFLTWSIRVTNRPQMLVNIIALFIGLTGMAKAIG